MAMKIPAARCRLSSSDSGAGAIADMNYQALCASQEIGDKETVISTEVEKSQAKGPLVFT